MSDTAKTDGAGQPDALTATQPGTELLAPNAGDVIIGKLTDLAIQETISRTKEEAAEMREMASRAISALYGDIFRRIAEDQFVIEEDRVNTSLVDLAIEKLDAEISTQLDGVMHHPEFQRLESAWRGLRYLVDRSPAAKNIEITMMSAREDELANDLSSQTWEKSGFFRHLYSDGLGSYGGKPYAAVVANYEFSPKPRHMNLLRDLAACSAAAQAPLISAGSPELLGLSDIRAIPNHADFIVAKQKENPKRFRDWTSFRNHPDSRYVCLTLPRFMLREPYGPDTRRIQSLNYAEAAADDKNSYLWGNSAFALASRLSQSFTENRWYNRIVGEKSGGIIERLPMYTYMKDGLEEVFPPTETFLNMNQEKTLATLGFAGLTMHRNESHAVFFGAQSVFDPTVEGQGDVIDEIKTKRALAASLPYTLIVTRISHYLTQMLHAYIGMQLPDKGKLEDLVSEWIQGYCLNQEVASEDKLLERPLRSASIKVHEVKGKPGFYKFHIQIMPHKIFQGAAIDLELDGHIQEAKQ